MSGRSEGNGERSEEGEGGRKGGRDGEREGREGSQGREGGQYLTAGLLQAITGSKWELNECY